MATETQPKSDFWDYFQGLLKIQGVPVTRFATDIGIATTTPKTWESRTPTWEMARKIAEYFNRPVAEVFVRCGYATAEELGAKILPPRDVSALSKTELLAELDRRIPDDRAEQQEDTEPEEQAAGAAPKTRKAVGQSKRQRVRP